MDGRDGETQLLAFDGLPFSFPYASLTARTCNDLVYIVMSNNSLLGTDAGTR